MLDLTKSRNRLITRFDLRDMGITYCNVSLLRLESTGKFPKRVRLSSHRVAWWESEVHAYLEQKSLERGQ